MSGRKLTLALGVEVLEDSRLRPLIEEYLEAAREEGRREMAEKVTRIAIATTMHMEIRSRTATAGPHKAGEEPRWYGAFRRAALGSQTDALRNRFGWEHFGACELRGILASYFADQGWAELEPSGEAAPWAEILRWLADEAPLALTDAERKAAKAAAADTLRLAELQSVAPHSNTPTAPEASDDPADHLIMTREREDLALWWAPKRNGYTVRLDEAGRYTEAEAKRQEASRDVDVAVPLALAEDLAFRAVSQGAVLRALRAPETSKGDRTPTEEG